MRFKSDEIKNLFYFFCALIKASNILAYIQSGLSAEELMKQEFILHCSEHFSVTSKNYSTDPKYFNQMKITTKSKELYIKETALTNAVMEDVLKYAVSVRWVIDTVYKSKLELPLFLCSLKTLKRMYLKNVVLVKNLSLITQLNSLEELEIHSCILDDLSSFVPVGSKLKKLVIESSTILECNLDVQRMPNLETLIIKDSTLSQINKQVFMMGKLKKVDFQFNHFTGFPVFDATDKVTIEEIVLANNTLEMFPSSINFCKKLKKLDMSNNYIKKFEEDFKFEKDLALEDLNLSGNLIEKLPKNMENLLKIKSLNLSYNKLKEVDPAIFRSQTIEKINLSYNRIPKISDSITGVAQLIWKGVKIHSGDTPFKLKEIDLSYNLLTSLPPSFDSFIYIEKLNLEGNVFSEVPDSVYFMKNLQLLNLAYNQLRELPSGLCGLNFLYEIDFSGGISPNSSNTTPTNMIRLVPRALLENHLNRTIKITLKGNMLQNNSTFYGFGKTHILEHYKNSFIL